MKFGIQHRRVRVRPAFSDDRRWIQGSVTNPGLSHLFEEYSDPARFLERLSATQAGILGIIETERDRVGFCLAHQSPHLEAGLHFSIFLPAATHRNAFTAISASYAFWYYLFDGLGATQLWWRIADDNRAPHAIAQREGFQPVRRVGHHQLYGLNAAGWKKTKARFRAPFTTLWHPPYSAHNDPALAS